MNGEMVAPSNTKLFKTNRIKPENEKNAGFTTDFFWITEAQHVSAVFLYNLYSLRLCLIHLL